jgi:hypothetical protein
VKDDARRSAALQVGVLFALPLLCGVGGRTSPPKKGGGLQPLLLRAKSVGVARMGPLPPPLA